MNCTSFKNAFADVYNARLFMSQHSDKGNCRFGRIGYCAEEDIFFRISADCESISATPVYTTSSKLSKEGFFSLYAEYHDCFINIERIVSKTNFEQSQQVWDNLYTVLLHPFLGNSVDTDRLFLCLDFNENNTTYTIDFSTIHHLKYRYYFHPSDEKLQVTTVTTLSIFNFLKNLVSLPFPEPHNAVLLYGLDMVPAKGENKETNAGERVFERLFPLLEAGGGKVVFFNSIEQLRILFDKQASPSYIHLIAHFHERRIFNLSSKSIGFHLVELMLEDMRNSGRLRDDIVLDAITCYNHPFFSKLYGKGIRYLHMSHHNLSTEIAAAMLYELYSGVNGKRLGWSFPYLDGKTYLHEAWGKVCRCFYTNTLLGKTNITF